jgi:hypothetical protein
MLIAPYPDDRDFERGVLAMLGLDSSADPYPFETF